MGFCFDFSALYARYYNLVYQIVLHFQSASLYAVPTRLSACGITRQLRKKKYPMDCVRLDPSDNVVTATRALAANAEVEGIATTALVPSGHKVATMAIAQGEAVRKYAQVIGYASQDIAAGDHVHTHNTEFRNTEADYEFSTDLRPVAIVPKDQRDTFYGLSS